MPGTSEELSELETKLSSENIWDDPKSAQPLFDRQSELRYRIDACSDLDKRFEDLMIYLEMANDGDQAAAAEAEKESASLTLALENIETEALLSGPYDHDNAILSVHAGAGGTDAQDWAEMLLRMYMRWCQKTGLKAELADMSYGEEAGIKSATVMIAGSKAYGFLKGENGIHRLVRLSPFDSAHRRHTSFAQVEVIPERNDKINIEINPKDLKIETYRSSGAGGQHVNKTDSAVRIIHVPSGIIVQCQNERSQHANKLTALKILKARLFEKERVENERKLSEIRGEHKDIGWGNQIRSYVFHPYSLVKDHVTGCETGNVYGVMDGAIDNFIKAFLIKR